MNNTKLIFGTLFWTTTLAFAVQNGSSDVGGGGKGLRRANGQIESADNYIEDRVSHEGIGDRVDLPPAVVEELRQMGMLMTRYGADYDLAKQKLDWGKLEEKSLFIEENVLGPNIEYRVVTSLSELGQQCDSMKTKPLPPEVELFDIMCTYRNTTFIPREVFDAVPTRMSVREFAKQILHERSHGLLGFFDHLDIAKFSVGTATAMNVRERQMKGDRREISTDEYRKITRMVESLQALGLSLHRQGISTSGDHARIFDKWYINRLGGGLISKDSEVAKSAFVSVGSVIGEKSSVGENSVVANTRCRGISFYFSAPSVDAGANRWVLAAAPVTCALGEDAQIDSLQISHEAPIGIPDPLSKAETVLGEVTVQIGPHFRAKNVRLETVTYPWPVELPAHYTLGARTELKNTTLRLHSVGFTERKALNFTAGDDLIVNDSVIGGHDIRLGSGNQFQKFSAIVADLIVGQDGRFENGSILQASLNLRDNVELKNTVLNLPFGITMESRAKIKNAKLDSSIFKSRETRWYFPYFTWGPSLTLGSNTDIDLASDSLCTGGEIAYVKGDVKADGLADLRSKICRKH
jgi:hypothetical protein